MKELRDKVFNDPALAARVGEAVANTLGLERKDGYFLTTVGPKTAEGLGATMANLLTDMVNNS